MIKMSVILSDEVAREVSSMATRQGISVSEVVRRCIGTGQWRDEVEKGGGQILVEKASGEVRRVHFEK